jgi:hypothetical protein
MNSKLGIVCATLVAMLMASTSSAATILFRDQMTDAAPWGVNVGGSGDVAYTFDYAYDLLRIPEAPNTQVGDAATRGVKLEANPNSPGTVDFFSLYPTGQDFTGSYRLRFDAWQNFEVDGSGTTEFLGGGIGYDNVTADIASGAQAMSTGDGGSSNDWRAFKSPPQFFIPDADMAAGTQQGSDPYYADFLPAVPAAQGQAGTSVAGSPGFQWITWDIAVAGDSVTINIEKPDASRLLIVEYDKTDTSDGSAGVSTDGNISLFYADFFDSVSTNPALAFGMIDNVEVTRIPEPTTLGLVGLAALALGAGVRRRR